MNFFRTKLNLRSNQIKLVEIIFFLIEIKLRSNKLTSSAPANVKDPHQASKPSTSPNTSPGHRHQSPPSKLHGPHNGQEYYAIDNIISDADFQQALNQSQSSGNIRLGVIIRTWSVNEWVCFQLWCFQLHLYKFSRTQFKYLTVSKLL